MYRLEYRYLTDTSDWEDFFNRPFERAEAIDMLYSAQFSDTINNVYRAWRINPSPWANVEAGQ